MPIARVALFVRERDVALAGSRRDRSETAVDEQGRREGAGAGIPAGEVERGVLARVELKVGEHRVVVLVERHRDLRSERGVGRRGGHLAEAGGKVSGAGLARVGRSVAVDRAAARAGRAVVRDRGVRRAAIVAGQQREHAEGSEAKRRTDFSPSPPKDAESTRPDRCAGAPGTESHARHPREEEHQRDLLGGRKRQRARPSQHERCRGRGRSRRTRPRATHRPTSPRRAGEARWRSRPTTARAVAPRPGRPATTTAAPWRGTLNRLLGRRFTRTDPATDARPRPRTSPPEPGPVPAPGQRGSSAEPATEPEESPGSPRSEPAWFGMPLRATLHSRSQRKFSQKRWPRAVGSQHVPPG